MIEEFLPIRAAFGLRLPRCFAFSNRWLSTLYFYFSGCCQVKCVLGPFGVSSRQLHSQAGHVLTQNVTRQRLIQSTRHMNGVIYKNAPVFVKSSHALIRSSLYRWHEVKNYSKCTLQVLLTCLGTFGIPNKELD